MMIYYKEWLASSNLDKDWAPKRFSLIALLPGIRIRCGVAFQCMCNRLASVGAAVSDGDNLLYPSFVE
jgi:hypothetical protein